MKISQLLCRATIDLDLKVENKSDAINKLVDLLDYAGKLNDKKKYKEEKFGKEKILALQV